MGKLRERDRMKTERECKENMSAASLTVRVGFGLCVGASGREWAGWRWAGWLVEQASLHLSICLLTGKAGGVRSAKADGI